MLQKTTAIYRWKFSSIRISSSTLNNSTLKSATFVNSCKLLTIKMSYKLGILLSTVVSFTLIFAIQQSAIQTTNVKLRNLSQSFLVHLKSGQIIIANYNSTEHNRWHSLDLDIQIVDIFISCYSISSCLIKATRTLNKGSQGSSNLHLTHHMCLTIDC